MKESHVRFYKVLWVCNFVILYDLLLFSNIHDPKLFPKYSVQLRITWNFLPAFQRLSLHTQYTHSLQAFNLEFLLSDGVLYLHVVNWFLWHGPLSCRIVCQDWSLYHPTLSILCHLLLKHVLHEKQTFFQDHSLLVIGTTQSYDIKENGTYNPLLKKNISQARNAVFLVNC